MPQVTAAPFPVTFAGTTYLMSPLTDKDSDEINNWLRASYIAMARESLTPGMSKSEREEILGIAMDRARRLSFIEGEGSKLVSTLEGFIRVVYQGLKKNHPDLVWEKFKADVFDLKNKNADDLSRDVDAATKIFEEINIGPASGSEKKTAES